MFVALLCFVFAFNAKSSDGADIIGGTEVKPHSLPFMAFLKPRKLPNFCGGILISSKWVLTAAHCSKLSKIEKVTVGLHSVKNGKDKYPWQERGVTRQVIHPSYNEKTFVSDLMLLEGCVCVLVTVGSPTPAICPCDTVLRPYKGSYSVKLDKPVMETKRVKWLTLGESSNYPETGVNCLVAGWGITNYTTKTRTNVLLSANVTVIDRLKCNSPEYYNKKPVITEGMICAGSTVDNHGDTCGGDSGGPLLCDNALVGVTSFGVDCGLPKKPGVYAHLSKDRLNWIKKTVGN